MVLRLIGAIAAAALVLTGCAQATEQAAENLIESQTGADVDVSDGGGTVTFSDEETDTTVQGGSGTELPAGFPSDIPQPPSGQLMAALENPDGLSVMWTVDGLTAEAFDAYVASVKSAGYSSEMSATDLDTGCEGFSRTVVLVGNGKTLSISGFAIDGAGQVSIVVAAE